MKENMPQPIAGLRNKNIDFKDLNFPVKPGPFVPVLGEVLVYR